MPPDAVIEALERAGLRALPTGLAHGTVTAMVGKSCFEITTLRHDVDTDGRHAVVAFTDDWRADATRRDFTINAMSMTRDGEVFDYFGGRADLSAGVVRFVGDAATRIAEDYLRILRFFRFYARFGRPPPDADAMRAIRSGVPGLKLLSAERVWSEMCRILAAPAPDAALALMAETGVLQAVLPGSVLSSVDGLPADPVLRLAALLRDRPAPLNLSGEQAARLAALQGPVPPVSVDDAELRRLLAETPGEILIGRSWIAGQDEAARARIAGMGAPVFPVQGRDLVTAGLSPGPEMGRVLKSLRKVWLASGCVATRDELMAQLAQCRAP
jgi:poly(A) polymerase